LSFKWLESEEDENRFKGLPGTTPEKG